MVQAAPRRGGLLMPQSLTAVVIGAGYAGEGHTLAMRHCGVEVTAICARKPEVVRAVADRLGVPQASTDWRATVRAVRPSIVCIGTPASLRREIVEEAMAIGAHVLCDKPLALTGAEAGRLYRLVDHAGVKHAYASTFRYDPSVAWLAELVREGRIGRLIEIESSSRYSSPPGVTGWSWWFDPAQGGGILQNGFTHTLGTLSRICGAPPVRVVGDTQLVAVRAPVVEALLHDFRQWRTKRLTAEETQGRQWREGEIEKAFRALVTFGAGGREVLASVTFNSGVPVNWPAGGLRLFGEEGTLVATGGGAYAVSLRRPGASEAEPLPVPARLAESMSAEPGLLEQDRWNALVRDFVADVRGEPHEPYPTFLDGWKYQVAIDAIRQGTGWTDLPA